MKFSQLLQLSLKDYEKHDLMIKLAKEVDDLFASDDPEKVKKVSEIIDKMNQIYVPLHIVIFPKNDTSSIFQIWRLDGTGVFDH